jgi:F-type H+-transporting ATPase subunit a
MKDKILHLLQVKEDLPSIFPHELFSVGPFSFSPATMMAMFAVFCFLFLAFKVKHFKLIPNKLQHLVEMLILFIYDFIEKILGDKKKAKEILPYVGSVFLFILFSNLISLLPFIGSIQYHGHHVFSASTADFNTTFALALAAVVIIHFIGVKENGLFSHLGHFIQIKPIITGFKKSIGDGFLGIIHFFVGLIEIIGELAKVTSLSLRLFGNMFAHEVLMIILLGSLSIGVPAIWMGMGILVGVVQAIVFMALITVYYSLLVSSHSKSDKH